MGSDDLVGAILAEYDLHARLFDDFRLATEKLLGEIIIRVGGLHVHSVTSRLKSRSGLEAKARRIGKHYSNLSEITDVVGVRIITNLEDEVAAVGQLIERHFSIDKSRSIDKRQMLDPDRFGYLSLHYVCSFSAERLALAEYRRFEGLSCEVQVRSMLQHAWAEVEHDLGYKAGATIPAPMRRRFSRLAGLLEIADSEFIRLRDELLVYAIEVQETIAQKPNEVSLDDVSLSWFIKTDMLLNSLEKRMADHVGATLELQSLDNLAAELKFAGINNIGDLSIELQKYSGIVQRHWEARVHGESKVQLGRGIGLFYLFQILVVLRGGQRELCAAFEKFKIGWSPLRRSRAASDIARSILSLTDVKDKL